MANEIQVQLNLHCANGSYSGAFSVPNLNITQAAVGAAGGVQSIPTTGADLANASLTTNGILAMQNLDATNWVAWGLDNGGTLNAIGRLSPGEVAVLRVIPGVALKMQANVAACQVSYLWLNA